MYLIQCYGFEYKTGSDMYHFYVRFLWTDPNIKTADWYLMNGYPAYPGAKLLVDENKTGDCQMGALSCKSKSQCANRTH